MEKLFYNIPEWILNCITVVSGIFTILTVFISIINFIHEETIIDLSAIGSVAILVFITILFVQSKKYKSLSESRMKITSDNYHKLLCEARNTYFDVMHSYKKKTLKIDGLTEIYESKLKIILGNLCEILSSFTQRKISACIKLICYENDSETIDVDNARLITFCRSSNSDTDRWGYEKNAPGYKMKSPILLKDNTDFYDIVSNDTRKDYFYQGNLKKYDSQLRKINGRHYENTNEDWADYYIGTIVVPIRIEYKRLYHTKKDDAYHIIGFLCVDSLSKDAFTEKQEKCNVDIVRSFADLIYILLGQYQHYLKKLTMEQYETVTSYTREQ